MKNKTIVLILLSALLLYTSYNQLYLLFHIWPYYFQFWQFPVNTAIWLFAVGGYVQWLVSGRRSSRLIRLWLFYVFFFEWFNLLLIGLYLGLRRGGYSRAIIHSYDHNAYRELLIGLPLMAGVCYMLIVLGRQRTALLTTISNYETPVAEVIFHPVDRGMRFAIRIIDLLFVMFAFMMLSSAINSWMQMTDYSYFLNMDSPAAEYFFLSIALLLYYFLMESVVGITFGKIVINTMIVNETGQRPSLGQLIGRSFSRLIPFDGWSFLFGERGWHDSLTGTYVVRGEYLGEKEA